MTVLDLATLLARDILDDIADSIADEIRQDTSLLRRITDRLRDELSTIEGTLLSEICSTAPKALTAADAIEDASGTDVMTEVEIFATSVEVNGQTKPCLRLRRQVKPSEPHVK